MDFDDDESGFSPSLPPFSLTPFPPSVSSSPRRLSSCFMQPSEPVKPRRQLAWVSLQGRLVGADEACSAKTIDRNASFSAQEAVAWELFTPIERVLIVAVAAAAAVNSKKNKQISGLRNSVQLRDQVLLSMQQKLDNLCEQANYTKDHEPQVVTQTDVFLTKRGECDCQHHNLPPNDSLINTSTKGFHGDDVFKYTTPDERRMSDLSDWAPSVSSSVDIQLDSLAIAYDVNSLRRECEQKDITISELSTFLQSSQVLGSKRIAELEDIIRRKNTIINKLRKDIMTLEQKVVTLTRLRRSCFPGTSSYPQHPPIVMVDNVLYDMDSTTDPSSDSDSSPRIQTQAVGLKMQETCVQVREKASVEEELKCVQVKSSSFMKQDPSQCGTTRPLLENSVTRSVEHEMCAGGGESRSRRRPPAVKSKEVVAPHKRWA